MSNKSNNAFNPLEDAFGADVAPAENKSETVPVVKEDGTESGIALTEQVSFDFSKADFKGLEKSKRDVAIIPEYWEPAVGESIRGFFIGLKTGVNEHGEERKTAVWASMVDGVKKLYSNSGVQLTRSIMDAGIKNGQKIELVFREEKPVRSGSGKVKLYDVFILS